MAHARSAATVHIVSGSAWVFGSLAIMTLLAAYQAPFVSLWIVGVVVLALGAFELAVGLRARRLDAGAAAGVTSRHAHSSSPRGADRAAVVDGGARSSEEAHTAAGRLSGSVNAVYGAIGVLAGVVFLILNLSDPAGADGGDWFWCAVGLVVGPFLLWRFARSRK